MNEKNCLGREKELNILNACLEECIKYNQPVFVLIEGEFGIGKTTLIEKFLSQHSECQFGIGLCDSTTPSSGFNAIKGVINSLIGKKDFFTKISQFARPTAQNLIDSTEFLPYGNTIKKVLTIGYDIIDYNKSKYQQDRTFKMYLDELSKCTKDKTTICILEDMEYSDESSLKLLIEIKQRLSNNALLMICTYNKVDAVEKNKLFKETKNLLYMKGATILELNDGIDVNLFIKKMYPNNNFPAIMANLIIEKTGGNPGFVRDILKHLEKRNFIIQTLSRENKVVWKLQGNIEDEITKIPSIEGLIEARLSLLEEELCLILRCAAAEGNTFTIQTLHNLLKQDYNVLYTNLENLEKKYGLVKEDERTRYGDSEFEYYKFTPISVRDHIFDKMSEHHRYALSKQVLEFLEPIYRQHEELSAKLSNLYSNARNPKKSIEYALKASEYQQALHAWAESKNWCKFALKELLKLTDSNIPDNLELHIRYQLALSYYMNGEIREAYEEFKKTLNMAISTNSPIEIVNLLYAYVIELCDQRKKFQEGLTYIRNAKLLLKKKDKDTTESYLRLLILEGLLQSRKGKLSKAKQILDDSTKLSESINELSPQVRIRMNNIFGIILYDQSLFNESNNYYIQALKVAQDLNDYFWIMTVSTNLAENYSCLGEFNKAEKYALESMNQAKELGDLDNESYASSILASILLQTDQAHDAIDKLEKAIQIAEHIGSENCLPFMYADLSLAYLRINELQKAHRFVLEGLKWADEPSEESYCLDQLGRTESALENWDIANAHFEKAISIQKKLGNRYRLGSFQRDYGESMILQHKIKKGLALIKKSLKNFEETNIVFEINRTQDLIYRLERSKLN